MERQGTRSGYRLFSDRREAGARLAEALDKYRGRRVLGLGIPRGGVPVAAEVARRLEAELDEVVARKLGAPMSRELAMGVVTANGGAFYGHFEPTEGAEVERILEQWQAARREAGTSAT
jgi:predicted phosphoribosyltransferase